MYIIDVSNLFITVLLIAITAVLILLGKEKRKSYFSGFLLLGFVALIIVHTIQVIAIDKKELVEVITLAKCICIDFVFIIVTFIAYLLTDELEARSNGKNLNTNGLDWFWNK